jgi:hypothetical protein
MRVSTVRLVRSLVFVLLVAGSSFPLAAADPPAPFDVDPGSTTLDVQPAPAVDSDGNLLLAWTQRSPGRPEAVVAARLGADGAILGGPFVWGSGLVLDVASLGRGFMGLRGDLPGGAEWAQRLAVRGAPVGNRQPLGVLQFLQVRGDPRGGAVAFGRGPDGVVGVRYAADGTVPGEPFVLERGAQRFDAGLEARGNIVLAFTDATNRLFVRRYTPARKPIGVRFNTGLTGINTFRIGVFPDGRFVLFYLNRPDDRVWGRAFRANGTPAGPPFAVSSRSASSVDGLSVAVDAGGTLLIVWKSFENDHDAIQGRFVAASGGNLGQPIAIGGPQPPAGPPEPRFSPRAVRLGPGNFRVFWVRGGEDPGDVHLRGQAIVR